MAAPTYYYVDPAGGTDDAAGGRGASTGSPWKTVQYALDHITRDSSNGDQINIKSGTDNTLGNYLSLTTYGTPTEKAQLTYRGYSSVANDNGVGAINGSGTYPIINTYTPFVNFIDLHLYNSGAATSLMYLNKAIIANCELDHAALGITAYQYCWIVNCHFHDTTNHCIYMSSAMNQAIGNFCNITSAAYQQYGIYSAQYGNSADHNIVYADGDARGIYMAVDYQRCTNNSVFSNGGGGYGILINNSWSNYTIYNNIVEGFSGAGGCGFYIDEAAASEPITMMGHNAVFNCTNPYYYEAGSDDIIYNVGNDETLTSSPFQKRGSLTFANRFNYFRPRNVGNILYGGYPSGSMFYKGAIPPLYTRKRVLRNI